MRYSKTTLAIILLSFFLILSISCSKKSTYPVQTEIIDGVKVITNPDFPRDGAVQYAMEEELSIGANEADENALLNFPREVKVADDGTIYVMDWRDVCIKVYDSGGKYLRSVGRKGEGPGEFNTPVYMELSPDGRIFLAAALNRKIIILDTSGNHLGEFRVEGNIRGIKTDDMNRIYFSRRNLKKSYEELPITKEYLEVENEVSIVRTDSGGEDMFQFGPFSGEKDRIRRMDKDNYLSGPPLYSIVWTVDEKGKLYQGFNQYYRINVFDPEGNRLFAFAREYIPVKNKRYSGRPLQLKYQPAFRSGGWILDDKENLWIPIYSENEDEMVYDVFSPEGIYLQQVTVPHLIYQLKNKKAYSIVSTEEGFRVVMRFKLREKAETK